MLKRCDYYTLVSPPDIWERPFKQKGPTVFLAGGFSDKGAWRKSIVSLLDSFGFEGVLVDPFIANYDAKINPLTAPVWESMHLESSDAVAFWFCAGSPQAMSVFELGLCLGAGKKCFVGIDENYPRRAELVSHILASGLVDPIEGDIDSLAERISCWSSE